MTLKASYFSAYTPETSSFHENSLIEVNDCGYITKIVHQATPEYNAHLTAAQQHDQLIILAPGHFLLPGFIDLHNHAPQWPQAGIALDRPLADWLNHYTFPLEARYKNLDFATLVYHDLITEMLANGTTTALYFGTIHNAANLRLAEICAQAGQRAFIGSVAMDNPQQTPDYYRDASAEIAVTKTQIFIQTIQDNYPSGLIQPVITPRFIPSCTTATLQRLGQLAKELQITVQTHCSESDWEHDYVRERFGHTDAEMLQSFGLLNQHAVLAHATQLTTEDQTIIKTEQSTIAHCPLSNAYFGNSVLPTRSLMDQGIQVGLGSDIAGGYTPSLYANLQQAVTVSQIRQDGIDDRLPAIERGVPNSRISVKRAFYLATVGGAAGLDIQAGAIEPGLLADFQVVKAPPHLMSLTPDEQLEQLLFRHTKQQIKAVYVQGKLVHEKEHNWYE
ncbi:guanine deaminase [Latilactobacillus graminis]|uniref:guanine deaminase n=1 Tax=Latilactobacillus graminis TaxID=60519 RepID=UPI000710F126|nr:guanine deaminase [Latilactobacillus graminis]